MGGGQEWAAVASIYPSGMEMALLVSRRCRPAPPRMDDQKKNIDHGGTPSAPVIMQGTVLAAPAPPPQAALLPPIQSAFDPSSGGVVTPQSSESTGAVLGAVIGATVGSTTTIITNVSSSTTSVGGTGGGSNLLSGGGSGEAIRTDSHTVFERSTGRQDQRWICAPQRLTAGAG